MREMEKKELAKKSAIARSKTTPARPSERGQPQPGRVQARQNANQFAFFTEES